MCRYQREDDRPCQDLLWPLARDVFSALAITCVLSALHRIANGLLIGSRVSALENAGAAYTPEEREALIRKIKRASLRF